jgi:hypothetical protein
LSAEKEREGAGRRRREERERKRSRAKKGKGRKKKKANRKKHFIASLLFEGVAVFAFLCSQSTCSVTR